MVLVDFTDTIVSGIVLLVRLKTVGGRGSLSRNTQQRCVPAEVQSIF